MPDLSDEIADNQPLVAALDYELHWDGDRPVWKPVNTEQTSDE